MQERHTVAVIVLVFTTLFAFLYWSPNGALASFLISVILTSIVFLGAYVFYELSHEKKHMEQQGGSLATAMQLGSLTILFFVVARVLLEYLAAPTGVDVYYAMLVGLQTSMIAAFFYIMFQTTRALVGTGKKTHTIPFGETYLNKLTPYIVVVWIAGISAVYAMDSYLQNTTAAIAFGAGASALFVLSLFLLSRKEVVYCRERLDEHNKRILNDIYFASELLTIFVMAQAIQEFLYLRDAQTILATIASGVQFATLLVTFLTMYFILDRFRTVSVEVDASGGKYRERFAG